MDRRKFIGSLALNPRPVHVLCLGDIAYLTGRPEEYSAAKKGLDRLEEAGMQVSIAQGGQISTTTTGIFSAPSAFLLRGTGEI